MNLSAKGDGNPLSESWLPSVPRGTILDAMKTTCSNHLCGNEIEAQRVGKHRYCLTCHAAKMRDYRARKREEAEQMKQELQAITTALEVIKGLAG